MSGALTLGDAGASNDDASYTGDVSTSPVSMDYFRARYLEFQQAMTAMDRAYQAGNAAYFASDPPDEGLYNLLIDYEQNASQVKAIAQTLSTAAAAVNALGGRLPGLSIPPSLGAVPMVAIGAAALVALASVSHWLAYSRGFSAGMVDQLERVRAMPSNAGKQEIEAALNQAVQARAESLQNPLGSLFDTFSAVPGIVKLAVVAGLGWLAWRSFGDVLDR